ncbi:uncharacterized protein LOC134839469 isoform X2 [Symsagittifera roscoffensis]|uniref:uncharacterized protein LOC134839469 isoform X2 n=1 Tax=Symsagittifera roscoffensis TaxID=84072 RepID=UPI00307C6C36
MQATEHNRLLRSLFDQKKIKKESKAETAEAVHSGSDFANWQTSPSHELPDKKHLLTEANNMSNNNNNKRISNNKVAPQKSHEDPADGTCQHNNSNTCRVDHTHNDSTPLVQQQKGKRPGVGGSSSSPTPDRVQSADSDRAPSGDSHSSPVTNGETAVKNLTDEQIEEFRKAFKIFDKDGDGNVSTDELGKVMRELGQNPSEDELQEMIEEIDKDGNGEIDFDEFLEMMAKQMNGPSLDQEIEEAWKLFNTQQLPTITKQHIRRVMERLTDYMTNEDLEVILGHVEVDGEDQITFEAFSNMMKSNPLEPQQQQPQQQTSSATTTAST